MKRLTTRAAAAGAVLVLGSLAGCGGSDSGGDSSSSGEDYCASLEEAKAQFDSLDEGDLANFEEAFGTLRELGDQAPEEISAEWDTMISGIDQLEQAVEEAGLTLDELAEIAQDPSAMPDDVDMAKLQELGTKMQELDSQEFTEAGDAITAHAEEECGITLDEGASEEPTTQ